MRFEGKITHWDDARGFGFISQAGGDDSVFVHIKAFCGTSRRPDVGDVVSYELGEGKNGKPRAENAYFADEPVPQMQSTGRRSDQRQGSVGPVLYACVFVGFLIAAAYFQRISWIVVGGYTAMSLLTFVVYGWDKLSAQLGNWRTRESTLLFMGLIGGWPGGVAAQHLFRHKSAKPSFLVTFWLTVILNVGAVGYLVWIGDAGTISKLINHV